MRILFCGDIVGRAGREAIAKHVPALRESRQIDLVIANGENAAAGFGITQEICTALLSQGVDLITSGNHAWDQKETAQFIQKEPRLLRPHNYANPTLPGKGVTLHTLRNQRNVLVINLLGQVFMKDESTNPFYAADAILKQYSLAHPEIHAIIVDFHAEATSEKVAMGHYLDGRVSFVVGTHTHVPTADSRVLSGGTAYQTDAGMCGDYNSVIGMEKQSVFDRFLGKLNPPRMTAATGEGTLSSVLVEIDDDTGLARSVERIILGPL